MAAALALRLICKLAIAFSVFALASCGPGDQDSRDDGTVVKDGSNLRDNPEILSPPILNEPIYECTSSVIVRGFVPDAEITVFADGSPVGNGQSFFTSGQTIKVSIVF